MCLESVSSNYFLSSTCFFPDIYLEPISSQYSVFPVFLYVFPDNAIYIESIFAYDYAVYASS
jgi:hypothetical protein